MNCDECKDQIFELIEREAVDAEGVREILDRCPACRDDFERLKATLARVADLPLEQPPAHIVARIAEAARQREAPSARARPRVAPVPWAIAAVALLGIGLGYTQSKHWGGGEDAFETQDANEVAASPESPPAASQPLAEQVAALADEKETKGESSQASRRGSGDREAKARAAKASVRPDDAARRRAKNATPRRADVARAVQPADGTLERATVRAQAQQPAPAAGVASSDAAYADDINPTRPGTVPSEGARGATAEESDGDVAPDREACKRRTETVRRRDTGDADDAFGPEDELELGRCYVILDRPNAARIWLERAAQHPETSARAKAALQRLE